MGGLVPDRVGVYDQEQGKVPTYKLQCYPLYSLLKAVGMCSMKKIDSHCLFLQRKSNSKPLQFGH